jgi:hypothetical protein
MLIDKKITEHKYLEIRLNFYKPVIEIAFSLYLRKNIDHGGLRFLINFIFFVFEFNIYDHRHWNDETDDYEEYNETDEE